MSTKAFERRPRGWRAWFVVSAALALGWSAPALAQAEDDFDGGDTLWGGFGFASVGFAPGDYGAMANSLGADDALGAGNIPSALGFQFGGGGRLLYGRLVLGGKGFGLITPGVSADRGEATLMGGGGGFDAGFTMVHRDGFLVYPFAGIGGLGFSMEIENTGEQTLSFGDRQIEPGQKATFQTGVPYFEIGAGAQWQLHDGGGGFNVGLEGGLLASVGVHDWEDANNQRVDEVTRVKFSTFYLKLTFGGGGAYIP